jgi:sterol desaturase/sphingolipid hydroxylase (fatty acid hydroxylase superfamily)
MPETNSFLAAKTLQLLTYAPLIAFGLIEEFFPRRSNLMPLRIRWTANVSLLVIDSLLMRWLMPFTTIGLAVLAEQLGMGGFNRIGLPFSAEVVLGFLLWDCSGFIRHRLFHQIPVLWRVHQVHHCDLDFDVTTSIRHHPLESLFCAAWDLGVVLLLGLDPVLVILYEAAQFIFATFNHTNIAIPVKLDRALRWFVVTPDMHRIHHSSRYPETDRNFGNILPWWDRLFASYLDTPTLGHKHMSLGLKKFRQMNEQTLWAQLIVPFLWRKRHINQHSVK